MNRNVMLVVAGIAVLVLVGGGIWFMSKRNTVTPATTPIVVQESPTTAPEASVASTDLKKFTVEGSNFKFSPSVIKVNKGDTVQITFKNVGGDHDFFIDEFGVSTNKIGDGEEEQVEFVADKAGTFDYYCSVANHRAMGMVGKLTVE